MLLQMLLDLFSSVRFGIFLLILLFIYMSVGSAGILYPVRGDIFNASAWHHRQLRQHRLLEMTEFEWFHWWPFNVLVGLIALTLIVTTLRRIRFSVLNLGVWMIHTGVITLIIGSLIYFGTKVEGDSPIARRVIVVQLLDEAGESVGEEVVMSSFSGSTVTVGSGNDTFDITVLGTDPAWELLSGDDAGKRVYSVNLVVEGTDRRFMRQVIAGYPEYTEDLVTTDDPNQPVQRAVKVTGERIIEPRLLVTFRYAPQDWFYLSNTLSKNWAIYLRRKGEDSWVERPVPVSSPLDPDKDGVPLYNDYVADPSSVLMTRKELAPLPDALDVEVVPVSPDDPLPDTTISIDSYLRYAHMQSRVEPGGPSSPLNPVVELELSAVGVQSERLQLYAFDPSKTPAEGGVIAFKYVEDETDFEQAIAPPSIRIEIPSLGIDEVRTLEEFLRSGAWSLEGDDYTVAIDRVQDDIVLPSGTVSVVFADITTPAGVFRRWVFSDGSLTRDVEADDPAGNHEGPSLEDDSIIVSYQPGRGSARVLVVAGPDPERLRASIALPDSTSEVQALDIGKPITLRTGIEMTVREYFPRARVRVAPMIVPLRQRHRDMGNTASWVRVLIDAPGAEPTWLRYHHYPFEGTHDLLSRFRALHDPVTMRVKARDGSWEDVEMIFSRRRMRFPDEIALESFELDTNVGGFTGDVASIRDYRSLLRFNENGTWSDPTPVSMNKPVEHGGLWYFQAQWDPPIATSGGGVLASSGLNYTVLGVGNRNGVHVQLTGCIIAVLGMIYAFYIKPVIKRSRQRRVQAGLVEVGT